MIDLSHSRTLATRVFAAGMLLASACGDPARLTKTKSTTLKNTLFALLGFILLSTPLAATAQQSGDFTYTSDGSAITITGYTGPGGAVTIPATIAGLPVTCIRDGAFQYKSSLTSVTIPGSVSYIGNGAFYNCTSLTNVTILNGVIRIENAAFSGCTSLTSVTIPDSVTSIGNSAFAHCTSLTSVIIPGSVTSICSGAFRNCTSLMAITVDAANAFYSSLDGVLFNKNLTTLIQYPGGKAGSYSIPGSVTSIGDEAFTYCASLTNVMIPGSVTNIGFAAFFRCTSLTSTTIQNGVASIGDSAFAHCTSLTDVRIPGSVTSFGGGPFYDCTSLIAITVDAANASYISLDGVLFNKNLTTLIQYPGGKTGSYAIPGSVTSIGNAAFRNCPSLKGVFFKGNAPNFGSGVFIGANNATVYYLPGTTGWGATFAGKPTVLWNPLMQTSDPCFGVGPAGFGFNITGTTNIPIVVEACTNLANATWVPMQSLYLTNGTFHFSDPDWTNYPARNYRIRSP